MRKVIGMALLLGGCVHHTFVPGPGMSSMNLESDAARCRLFARGERADFAFQASGSRKFVAASSGGAAIGYAIGSAIEQNSNFNDCMEAGGWMVADGQQPAAVTLSAADTQEEPAAVTTLVPVTRPRSVANPRRQFLVRAADVPFEVADFRPPHGVFILEVGIGGAALAAGLQERDVILDFNGSSVTNVADLQRALASIGPRTTVVAKIRRDGEVRPVAIHF